MRYILLFICSSVSIPSEIIRNPLNFGLTFLIIFVEMYEESELVIRLRSYLGMICAVTHSSLSFFIAPSVILTYNLFVLSPIFYSRVITYLLNCLRLSIPSLLNIFLKCARTLFTLIPRKSAISVFVMEREASMEILNSTAVSLSETVSPVISL